MAELKTKKNTADVNAFLNSIQKEDTLADCQELVRIMSELTGDEPSMWGPSIVGFGSYNYRYKSGRTGKWFLTGFSPRKQSLTLYIMSGFDHLDEQLSELGKHKTGKGCLYIKRLDDIDRKVLRSLIQQSVEHLRKSDAS